MVCKKCGSQLDDKLDVCNICGEKQGKEPIVLSDQPSSWWWFVFGLFLPIVAVILYMQWRFTRPNRAKKLWVGALIGLGILLVVYIVLVIVFFVTHRQFF